MADFDFEGALKAGYNHDEILRYLASPEGQRVPPQQPAAATPADRLRGLIADAAARNATRDRTINTRDFRPWQDPAPAAAPRPAMGPPEAPGAINVQNFRPYHEPDNPPARPVPPAQFQPDLKSGALGMVNPEAGIENIIAGGKKMWQPSGTTADNPEFWNTKAEGAAQALRGVGTFGTLAAPLGFPAAVAAPVPAIGGLVGGAGAAYATDKAAEAAGVPEGQRELLSNMAGAWGGAMGGQLTPEQVAAGAQKASDLYRGAEDVLNYAGGSPERGSFSQKPAPSQAEIKALAKQLRPDDPTAAMPLAEAALKGRDPAARAVRQRFDLISRIQKADKITGSEQSTRVPTAVRATEDPIGNILTTGYESWQRDPEMMGKNVRAMLEYPNFRSLRDEVQSGRVSMPQAAERIIDHIQENLQWLHDAMPEEFRNRSRLWYDGAQKIARRWATQHAALPEQVAGVMAVTSPGTDWFVNAERARRMLEFSKARGSVQWDPRMEQTWRDKLSAAIPEDQQARIYSQIRGKSFNDVAPDRRAVWFRLYDEAVNPREYYTLNPEGTRGALARTEKGAPGQFNWADFNQIEKGLSILEDGSKENIHRQLGTNHKIRNFYNNIINPNSGREHTTIDTHAVGAGLMRPISQMSIEAGQNFGGSGASSSSISGEKGTYGLWKEAYRRVARDNNLLPREMQSITWEAIRSLFSRKFKSNAANVAAINALWEDVSTGRLTADQARQRAQQIAGGFDRPAWFKGEWK